MRHDGVVEGEKRREGEEVKKKSELITLGNIYLGVQGVKVKAGNVA